MELRALRCVLFVAAHGPAAIVQESPVRSRAEPGCIAHNCHVDCEDESQLVFLELWQDMAAVQAHFAVPESGQFVRELTQLASAPPEMRIFDASEIKRG